MKPQLVKCLKMWKKDFKIYVYTNNLVVLQILLEKKIAYYKRVVGNMEIQNNLCIIIMNIPNHIITLTIFSMKNNMISI